MSAKFVLLLLLALVFGMILADISIFAIFFFVCMYFIVAILWPSKDSGE